MSWTRAASTLIFALALMIPSTQAALLLDIDQPDAVASWGLTKESLYSYGPSGDITGEGHGSADFALDLARSALLADVAGDIDFDGSADVVLQTLDLDNGFVVVEAISGAGLDASLGEGLDVASTAEGYADGSILWTMTPNQGSLLIPVGDVDGDFIADFVVAQDVGGDVTSGGSFSGDAEGYAGANLYQLMSGADIGGNFGVQLANSVQNTAGSSSSQVDFGAVIATGADSVHQIESTITTTSTAGLSGTPIGEAAAGTALDGAVLASTDSDATITVLDAAGEVQGRIEFVAEGDAETLLPTDVEAPDLDLDGHADTAVVVASKFTGSPDGSGAAASIHSFMDSSLSSDATATADWVFNFDANADGDFTKADQFIGDAIVVPDVGDVNADGYADMAFHALVAEDVAANGDLQSALVIVSGKDGAELASSATAAGSLLFAGPLGGDIDGDAAAEFLVLSGADVNGAIETVSVATAASGSLQTLWEIDIPADAAPVNLVTDEYTAATAGLSDLNGDGVVDLAIASGFVASAFGGSASGDVTGNLAGDLTPSHLDVFSGVDGELLYSLDFVSNADAANEANVVYQTAADASAEADGAASASGDVQAQANAAAQAADSTALDIEMIESITAESQAQAEAAAAAAAAAASGDASAEADAAAEAAGDVSADGAADAAAEAQAEATGRFATVEAVNAEAVGNGFVYADELALRMSQAADGAGIFRVPLIDEETMAEFGSEAAFTASIVGQGDVNADGFADVLVRVEGILTDAEATDVSQIQGQLVAHTEAAFDQIYVIDGQTGATLDSEIAITGEASALVEGDPDGDGNVGLDSPMSAGSVQQLEAYGSSEGGVDTPGVGLLPIMALLGAVVVALRRRK